MTDPKTHTLDVPGAGLHYDVRSNEASTEPVLLIIGSPMGATGFGTLAGHFADRAVVTYDPRGADRSRRTDGAAETTPDEHADDLHRLIAALDAGPVDIFASSGGAGNARAPGARPPEEGPTPVAHEPPPPPEAPDPQPGPAAWLDIPPPPPRRVLRPARAEVGAALREVVAGGRPGSPGPGDADRAALRDELEDLFGRGVRLPGPRRSLHGQIGAAERHREPDRRGAGRLALGPQRAGRTVPVIG